MFSHFRIDLRRHVGVDETGRNAVDANAVARDLAGERVATTMLSPEQDFVYRPPRVQEPFAGPLARRFPLGEIARDVGFELKQDALKRLDPERLIVVTETGEPLAYDALLLALGARAHLTIVTPEDAPLAVRNRGG